MGRSMIDGGFNGKIIELAGSSWWIFQQTMLEGSGLENPLINLAVEV